MEVLIATVILSIVVLTVCAFIVVGSRSYASANSDINVQQEAQLSLNQMSDVLIDTTRSVNYVGYDAGGNTQKALKDAEFTFTPEDKSLIMYNGVVEETPAAVPGGTPTKTVDAGNGNKHYHFYWSKDAETLYYAELDVQSTDVDTAAIHFPAFDPTDPAAAGWVVLAERVTDFSVDLSQVEEKRVVQLALTFLDGRKEYVTSNNVTIRNKVGVNDAELAPLNKKKTLSVTPRDAGVILEPGETYHFSTPKVTGDNVADRSVTWSLVSSGSPTGGTVFTDAANGILQVATDEPAGTLDVMITTNAVDSDGNPASCTLVVYIKRVRAVSLSKTGDADADNGPLEVSVGNEFTIGAVVEGEKLGVQCSGCTADISHDFHVVDWRITQGAEFVDIVDAGDCKQETKYCVKAGTEVGTEIKIAATSELSKNRLYTDVHGEITLTVAKSKDNAEPYKGKLKYGEQTLDESVRDGLPTDFSKYVTAIRVVDNSGREPDKVLLHYTIGGGNNYRICPDLFDLDLNGSYTFYMQAIFPIAEDRYVPGQGGYADDNATIREEYFSHLDTGKPYGYVGTRYRHGKVFYAKLDKPKVTYQYKGVEYTGKNITYDPVNIFTVGLGSGIVGEIRPTKYENIVDDSSVWNKMYNSLYEGEGNSQSQWNKVYYYDDESKTYQGSNTLADGAVQIDPRGSMFMKLNSDNNKQKACGSYHIVPGMTYKNQDPGHYEIIGYDGFDFPNLPREERYYEFDDSTIHVEITDEFTMEINHSDFKGQAMFPLPKEMKNSPLFPNIQNLDWQTSSSKLTVKAMRDGNSWTEDLTFSYVRYRYIKTENAWEVEPIRQEYRAGSQKILVHSYGIYKCGENGKKWECIKRGSTTEKDFTIRRFDYNGGSYQADFPLPTDVDFPFADGTGEITRTLELFDSNMQSANNVPAFIVSCKKNGDAYEIEFRTEKRENEWDVNNHKIRVVSYGTYTWNPGQKEWTWKKGNSTSYKTDLVTNLEGVLVDNTPSKMYFPLPSESGFPFKGGVTKIDCTSEHLTYAMTDIYGESAKNWLQWNASVKYEHSGNIHRITFVGRYNENSEFGTFEYTDGATGWTKVN